MSNDLISRKALLEKLEEWCGSQTYLISEEVWKIIKNSPKAFDKEKVIEELKGEIELCVTHPLYPGRYIKKDRAVEIVEKGRIE